MRNNPTTDALVILRLRQWRQNREILRSGVTRRFVDPDARPGRKTRSSNSNHAEARLIAVIDLERVLNLLHEDERTALIAVYHDGQTMRRAAEIMDISDRKMAYLLPAARAKLANLLDRRNLL